MFRFVSSVSTACSRASTSAGVSPYGVAPASAMRVPVSASPAPAVAALRITPTERLPRLAPPRLARISAFTMAAWIWSFCACVRLALPWLTL